MKATATVSLNLSADTLDFDQCSACVGVPPTRTWSGGISHPLVPGATWALEIKDFPCESIDDAIVAVLELVRDREGRIRELRDELGLEVSVTCNVTITEDRPLYELAPSTVQRLANLNASFLLDIFDYSE